MKKLFTLIILNLLAFNAFAQANANHYLPHNGGNGGDPLETKLKNSLEEIADFIILRGKTIFEKDFNSTQFYLTAMSATLRVHQDELYDRFGTKKCALNFPAEELIVLNRSCITSLLTQNDLRNLYVLLTHEVLNLMGLELPDQNLGSIYPISSKIGPFASFLSTEKSKTVFSKTCNLHHSSWIIGKELSRVIQRTLKNKGFNYIESSKTGSFEDLYLRVDARLFDVFEMKQIIDRSPYLFASSMFYSSPTFLIYDFDGTDREKDFNGFLNFALGNESEINSPNIEKVVPVKMKEKTRGQMTTLKISSLEEAVLEGISSLPDCVRY